MRRRGMSMTPRSAMMRTMPALAMMMLPRARRSHSRNQHDRNDRNQRQFQNVFHVKSPDPQTLGDHHSTTFLRREP